MTMTHSHEKQASTNLKTTGKAVAFIHHTDMAVTMDEVGAANSVITQLQGDMGKEKRWISKNIRMKICSQFIENKNPRNKIPDLCYCGRKWKEHTEEARNRKVEGKWSKSDYLISLPTSAYGRVEFPNANIAKYVRASDDTEMDYMTHLLTDVWGLDTPNLLISVTGGAKNIVMSKKLKDAFKKGLLKTAQSTGAWIVSGGTNLGVMKYVGEAVSMLQSSTRVVAFGVAPWGCIRNKNELTSTPESPQGRWPAYYSYREEGPDSKNVPLDSNHTHYILVDDGTSRKFGTEIEFRAKFEKEISKLHTDGDEENGTRVPVVSIVVEGGPGTLDTVKAAIDNATPVVVLEGSGRAADMLAFAYKACVEEEIFTRDENGKEVLEKIPRLPDEAKSKLRAMVKNEWKDKESEGCEAVVQTIIQCVTRRHLMVIFSLTDNDSMNDIDVAILHAIMKAHKGDSVVQLKLALAWNRIDIVKDEIFTEDKTWKPNDLESILQTALLQNKVDFVELLMEHIHLGNFLTINRLVDLYNNIPKNHLLQKLIENVRDEEEAPTTLEDVGDLLQELIGDFYSPLYKQQKYKQKKPEVGLLKRAKSAVLLERRDTAVDGVNDGSAINCSPLDVAKTKAQIVPVGEPIRPSAKKYDFDSPSRELFLWCVLLLRKDLAMLFLQEEKHAIAPALLASIILRNLMDKTLDTELVNEIEEIATHFESLALGVLSECYSTSENKGKALLRRRLLNYGNSTLLQLAVEAGNKQFISHQCCQRLLDNIWWGKMENQSNWRIGLTMVFPPLIFWTGMIKFRDDDKEEEMEHINQRSSTRKKKSKTIIRPNITLDELRQTVVFDERGQHSGSKVNFNEEEGLTTVTTQLTIWQKLIAFYNAPKVTFVHNCLFYLVFLFLFSYMMLCDFNPNEKTAYTWIEILIAVWVITLFIEELRQLWVTETHHFRLKLRQYFTDVWNVVDVFTLVLFIIGYVLRVVDHQAIGRRLEASVSETISSNIYFKIIWEYFVSNPNAATTYGEYEFLDANKWSDDFNEYSKVFLCLSLMTFFFRLLHIFSVFRILGPKLVMIGRMMKDLASFFVILFVFIMAFGVAQQGILYPNSPPTLWVIYRVLRKSYWQMYGELFLEEIEGNNECTEDPYCDEAKSFLTAFGTSLTCADLSSPLDFFGTCADNSTLNCYGSNNIAVPVGYPPSAFPDGIFVPCYTNSSGELPACDLLLPRCPIPNPVVPFLLGLYILITQVLMFNLLIAMFSYTFEQVQENTDSYWMFQRYSLIKEYYTRPPIPPPLIIINHFALLIRHIYRNCCAKDRNFPDVFKIDLDEQKDKQLTLWERINYEEYKRKKRLSNEESVQYKVTKSSSDLDQVMSRVDAVATFPQMDERVKLLETKMNETSEALNWIMTALSSANMGKGKPPMLKTREEENQEEQLMKGKEQQLFEELKKKKGGAVHVKCRISPYIKASRIRRFPVPDIKVYWEIPWLFYEPVNYTAEEVLAPSDWSDVDLMKMRVEERMTRYKFNQMDGNVDRRSVCGKYEIDKDGLPLNPFGRTGITGRGLLGRWGPNHALDGIVSRWKKHNTGQYVMKNEKRILEFIGVKRADVQEWALPGMLKEPIVSSDEDIEDYETGMTDEQLAIQAVKEKAFASSLSPETMEKLKEVFEESKVIYHGYVDDPRNTDNAWMETMALNFHDETHATANLSELLPGEKVTKVAWIEATQGVTLFAGHGIIIEKLAKTLDAAY